MLRLLVVIIVGCLLSCGDGTPGGGNPGAKGTLSLKIRKA
jgi:hypothetical protein